LGNAANRSLRLRKAWRFWYFQGNQKIASEVVLWGALFFFLKKKKRLFLAVKEMSAAPITLTIMGGTLGSRIEPFS